jgi:hypothetical protein
MGNIRATPFSGQFHHHLTLTLPQDFPYGEILWSQIEIDRGRRDLSRQGSTAANASVIFPFWF